MGYYGPCYQSYGYGCYGGAYYCPPTPRGGSGWGIALIVVLVILLIILGCNWYK